LLRPAACGKSAGPAPSRRFAIGSVGEKLLYGRHADRRRSPHRPGARRAALMETVLHGATFVALAAVVIVLALGIINMVRGNSGNRSQLFMRWRVILQFVAIVIMMTALYFSSK
jgi:Hypoxia induced protein conserved region